MYNGGSKRYSHKGKVINEYVALWFTSDKMLGPTIKCKSFDEAISHCKTMAEEYTYHFTEEIEQQMENDGYYIFDNGSAVYVGLLE